jgi:hypothetical protein
MRNRHREECAQVDAAIADASGMQEFAGPRVLAAALSRFEYDDGMASAAESACARSLDIIEKISSMHAGVAGESLLSTCTRLLMASGLPLQLFRCFCVRFISLDVLHERSPRCQLMMQLLTTTCRCLSTAMESGVDLTQIAADIAQSFCPGQSQRQLNCSSLLHLMTLILARSEIHPTGGTTLLLLSLLLAQCSPLALDTTAIFPVALHIMLHHPLSLMEILASSYSSLQIATHLLPPSRASLLFVLASCRPTISDAGSPAASAVGAYAVLLLRITLISFARDSPLHPATLSLYERTLALIIADILQLHPGIFQEDTPLLEHFASDDQLGASHELIQMYNQQVFRDAAVAAACSQLLETAADSARSAAAVSAALQLMQI